MRAARITRERGFALVTVLILLAIMLMAGTALFRNVDTAALISGNSAARQAASQAGNLGLVAAQKRLEGGTLTSPAAGYSDKALKVDSADVPIAADSVWSATTEAGNGYRYRYLIERLCNDDGVCAQSRSTGRVPGSSLGVNAIQPSEASASASLYRVTVQVTGPRNIQTYAQAIYGK